MTPARFLALAVDPALSMLPFRMTSDEARAMAVSIAWQETGLQARRQKPSGPARGFTQFELIAVAEVLTHRQSRVAAAAVCAILEIEPTVEQCYRAIEFNDVLCGAFTRLLLWTIPDLMPPEGDVERGWQVYLKAWKPGAAKIDPVTHRRRWDESFAVGWRTVREQAGASG